MAAAEHNAYVPGYAAKHIQHHEWRTAENSAQYLLPALQHMAREIPRLRLLDVGAGSGTISTSLARYIPHGHVTAVDLSPEILERAKGLANERSIENISFQPASVYELPFPDATFDVVHASMMLAHLDAPVEAYREMLRVTKPGGIVANRESDIRMWTSYPEFEGIRKFQKTLLATMRASGAQPDAGPALVSWAMKAGARREDITSSFGTWTYSTPEERQIWGGTMAERIRDGNMRAQALEQGITTEADFEIMARDWEKWMSAEDACFGCLHGEILIRK